MLDLRRLRLLREVDARGTVHGAARALDYTPSAVSQQLAVLERETGAKLLERSGRNVRLTDAGRVLVRHAGVLLDGVEAAEGVPALRLRQLDVVVGDEYEDQPRPVHADLVRETLVREQVRLVMPSE